MKPMELRAFLRVAYFASVEKDGTVWVNVCGYARKQKTPASSWRKESQYYLVLLIRLK